MIKKTLLALSFAIISAMGAYAQEEVIIDMEDDFGDDELVAAPDFTLKDIDGNDITLTAYQGDWVVLDFWGSWCRYCVQGIPAMKEAYAKYHPQGLQIIGIDCGEPEETWRDAVARFELPWINVYNPENRREGLCQTYGIQGFPTKIIVNPEGYIYETFLGEDPAFYEFLKLIFPE